MLNDVEGFFKSFDANIVLEAFVRMGTDMNQKPVAGFKISGTINRDVFGITKYPAALLGDEITLSANGEFDKTICCGFKVREQTTTNISK